MKKNIKCSMFIIPNSAPKVDDLIIDVEETYNQAKSIDPNFDRENDKLIEVWMHNEDSDNFQSHGLSFEDGHIFAFNFPFYIPSSILKNVNEADIINIKLNTKYIKFNNDEEYREKVRLRRFKELDFTPIELDMEIKCDQLNYRYGRFGSFEEVLEKVM